MGATWIGDIRSSTWVPNLTQQKGRHKELRWFDLNGGHVSIGTGRKRKDNAWEVRNEDASIDGSAMNLLSDSDSDEEDVGGDKDSKDGHEQVEGVGVWNGFEFYY